jgi:colanic acid/amylovoran biosynthesis glycosyltransferase
MLAVFTPELGSTFINKHTLRLAPGMTVAVSQATGPEGGWIVWDDAIPILYLEGWMRRPATRIARRLGLPLDRQRDFAVAQFLRRYRVTVVLGEFLDWFVQFVPVLERLGIPYVVQSHGVDASAMIRIPKIAKSYQAYRSAKAILTRNTLHRRRLIELGLPESKVQVNIGGVDVPSELPSRSPEAGRRFLTIAHMKPKKSPIYMLEAFRRALAIDPNITLDYASGGSWLPAAKDFVRACGLSSRVRLHGIVSEEDKVRLLRECGAFILHSLTDPETGDEEGLPAAIQEAMAHGLPVVSTRHSGIPEAVIDGVTGLLVNEGDLDGMARAMVDVIPQAAAMGKAGYHEALAKHAWRFERARLANVLGLPDPGDAVGQEH